MDDMSFYDPTTRGSHLCDFRKHEPGYSWGTNKIVQCPKCKEPGLRKGKTQVVHVAVYKQMPSGERKVVVLKKCAGVRFKDNHPEQMSWGWEK